jgi:hypothetical protein
MGPGRSSELEVGCSHSSQGETLGGDFTSVEGGRNTRGAVAHFDVRTAQRMRSCLERDATDLIKILNSDKWHRHRKWDLSRIDLS